MEQTFKTWCPLFPGFYNTVFEYSNEDEDINYYNEENKTHLSWDDFNFNYRDYERRVSKAFVNKLESELKDIFPVKMDFEKLYSPKEYNFYNDSIWIELTVDLNKLIEEVKKGGINSAQYFKNHYTSCSGFWSFHSNRIEDWLDRDYILEETEHRVGALLACICDQHFTQDDFMYWADDETGYIDFGPKETVNK